MALRAVLSSRKKQVSAALGRIDCDLILKNVRYLNVFTLEWMRGDISIYQGKIVGLDSGLKAKRQIDLKGKHVVPGFIDAHVHVESSLMLPQNFEKSVLMRGTTTAVCDPHELSNVIGVQALEYFTRASENLHLDLRVMLSSCVPATSLETNGGGEIRARDLKMFKDHPQVLGLAEMMNVPGLLGLDQKIWDKIELFKDSNLDGHCPLVTGHELSACRLAGISTCHESSELEEAKEKLRKGFAVWIREGSVAKDLEALAPLITTESSPYLGFCTDDRNPLDIFSEGHIDYMIRKAIQLGVRPEAAYRCASLSVARHYGLREKGAIAPGFDADLVVLDNVVSCSVAKVLVKGHFVNELDLSVRRPREGSKNSILINTLLPEDLKSVEGQVHVIGVEEGKILTRHEMHKSSARGVARLCVVERHGHRRKPAHGFVRGFGEGFTGAIGSSVGHDSHNLIAAGSNEKDMAFALNHLKKLRGGFCIVQNETVLADLALPFGGLMSLEAAPYIREKLQKLRQASRVAGCILQEPFLQLAFLSLPVIPSLKLTDRGLVDVEKFKIIPLRV